MALKNKAIPQSDPPRLDKITYVIAMHCEPAGPTWFGRPGDANMLRTYLVPPGSTSYGILNCARGKVHSYHWDRYLWRTSVTVLDTGKISEDVARIHKAVEKKEYPSVWHSTVVTRQIITDPEYIIYYGCDNSELALIAWDALAHPFATLALGQSDAMLVIKSLTLHSPTIEPLTHIDSIVPGIVDGCIPERLTVRFKDVRRKSTGTRLRDSAIMRQYSIPPVGGIDLDEPMMGYKINGKGVVFDMDIEPEDEEEQKDPNGEDE